MSEVKTESLVADVQRLNARREPVKLEGVLKFVSEDERVHTSEQEYTGVEKRTVAPPGSECERQLYAGSIEFAPSLAGTLHITSGHHGTRVLLKSLWKVAGANGTSRIECNTVQYGTLRFYRK